jgi:hypothetical protein
MYEWDFVIMGVKSLSVSAGHFGQGHDENGIVPLPLMSKYNQNG